MEIWSKERLCFVRVFFSLKVWVAIRFTAETRGVLETQYGRTILSEPKFLCCMYLYVGSVLKTKLSMSFAHLFLQKWKLNSAEEDLFDVILDSNFAKICGRLALEGKHFVRLLCKKPYLTTRMNTDLGQCCVSNPFRSRFVTFKNSRSNVKHRYSLCPSKCDIFVIKFSTWYYNLRILLIVEDIL